jgi:hypothetical protein
LDSPPRLAFALFFCAPLALLPAIALFLCGPLALFSRLGAVLLHIVDTSSRLGASLLHTVGTSSRFDAIPLQANNAFSRLGAVLLRTVGTSSTSVLLFCEPLVLFASVLFFCKALALPLAPPLHIVSPRHLASALLLWGLSAGPRPPLNIVCSSSLYLNMAMGRILATRIQSSPGAIRVLVPA